MEVNGCEIGEDMSQVVDNIMQEYILYQHSVRHIRSIQVRNFTPFPARDTLTSNLLHRPNPPSQAVSADDADILLLQRRNRRVSSASIRTQKGIALEARGESPQRFDDFNGTPRVRKRTNSRASTRTIGQATTAGPTPSSLRSRQRTTSHSSLFDHSAQSYHLSDIPTSSSFSIPDTLSSQKELESAIWSRLLPTFLTISLIDKEKGDAAPIAGPSTGTRQTGSNKPAVAKLSKETNGIVPGRASPTPNKRKLSERPEAPLARTKPSKLSSRTQSPSRISTGTPKPSPKAVAFPHSPPLTPLPTKDDTPAPIYISSFHRPSTNPLFQIELDSARFGSWSNVSVDSVRLELWGKCKKDLQQSNDKGKGKLPAHSPQLLDDEVEWSSLRCWDMNLSDLVPLPGDQKYVPTDLPMNTLLITFAPSGQTFYLPSPLLDTQQQSPDPSLPEYNSDTELDAPYRRKPIPSHFITPELGRRRNTRRNLESSSFQDLVKLTSLQAVIADTQASLSDLLRSCDQLIQDDLSGHLRRESAEREYHIRNLQEQRDIVDDSISSAQDDIQRRKDALARRRRLLAEARALHEDDLISEFDKGAIMARERQRGAIVKSQIHPIRTSLISTLAWIFPIDLLSPPDLLFTILSVPLPIPLSGTDPAPPLSLASCNDVSEDGVATALGYAALVVHLMASYLSRLLIYPITYIGSRSLIKDPISAMVGPRMFPLYSKGVDTYRFEYAVFLLNKDIEMLMADRDLQALDMRQTLPNLKNLLLTLTSGEDFTQPKKFRRLVSPSISSGLQTPIDSTEDSSSSSNVSTPPPMTLDSSTDSGTSIQTTPKATPKLRSSALPALEESTEGGDDSPTSTPASQSSSRFTNAASSVANLARRPKVYLGLAPLTSMFRRSSSAAGKSIVRQEDDEAPVPAAEGTLTVAMSGGSDDFMSDGSSVTESEAETASSSESASIDEEEEEFDDRQTIRGVSAPVTPVDSVGPRIGIGKGVLLRKGEKEEKECNSAGEHEGVAVVVSTT